MRHKGSIQALCHNVALVFVGACREREHSASAALSLRHSEPKPNIEKAATADRRHRESPVNHRRCRSMTLNTPSPMQSPDIVIFA
jgi:hypothetical protein